MCGVTDSALTTKIINREHFASVNMVRMDMDGLGCCQAQLVITADVLTNVPPRLVTRRLLAWITSRIIITFLLILLIRESAYFDIN